MCARGLVVGLAVLVGPAGCGIGPGPPRTREPVWVGTRCCCSRWTFFMMIVKS